MANDNRAEIVLDGDVSPLRQKLREAQNALKQFGTEGESSVNRITGPLGALQSKFIAIGALLAGGAVFKEAVAQTAMLTEESTKLGRALGISASEASVLREALEAGNTSQEEFVGAAKGLAKQIRENEGGLQAMGLKTRDAAGQLRPLNDLTLDAIGVLNKYRSGTDRAIAGQALFGKGFEMTSNLANMNKQAVADVTEQMQALGVVVGEENVKSWEAFDDAGDRAGLTMKALKVTIGNALLPVLTALNNAFAAAGPYMVRFARVVMETFLGVADLFRLVKQAFVSVGSDIGAVAAAAALALKGDFSGAMEVFRARARDAFDETKRLKDLWNGTGDSFLGKFRAQETQAPAPAPEAGGQSAGGLIKKDKAKKEKQEDPSHMGAYEAMLAERKNLYEQENTLRQFSKEQELAYWRELQATYQINSKDQLAIAKRTATLELDIRREAAKSERELRQAGVDHQRNMALAQVQYEEQRARFAQENGEITKRALIDQEEAFARRRFEIEYQAQLERIELAKTDPSQNAAAKAQLNERLLELEREYNLRRGELQQDKKKADGTSGLFDDIGSSFGSAANAMLTSARSLQQGLLGIFQGIYSAFITNMVTKPLGEWIATQAKMLAVKLGFVAQEKTIEAASSAATVGIKATETTAVVSANAAQAGAGAAASQASIPFVGPALALAAMAAVFGAVMAMGNRKSAARGYDIPKGLNPLTQLHEEEMVLPQKYANVIRGLAAGGAAESSSAGGDVHIYARNDDDVVRVGDMKKLLREMGRNFVNVKR